MRSTNFTNGILGKVFGAILCILLGVVLAFGGVALAGYIAVTREGMVGTVEDLAQKNDLPIDFAEEMRDMTLLAWGQEAFKVVSAISTTPIGDIELAIGYSALSSMISDATGLAVADIKATTIVNIGKTLTEKLTLGTATEKFGIELPDMPIFSDSEFLGNPLSTAFGAIDEFELQDFVEIGEDASPIMQSLKDMKVGEMSNTEGGLDDRINNLTLAEVITIDENSTPVLIELQDTKIGELGAESTNDKINNMKIADLMDITEESSQVMKYFRDNNVTIAGKDELDNPTGIDHAITVMTLKDMMIIDGTSTKILQALKDSTLDSLGTDIDALKMSDVMDITAESPAILRKLRAYDPETDAPEDADKFGTDVLVSNLDTELDPIIQGMKLGEIISITPASEPILVALQDTTLSGLNTKIATLKVSEVFSETQCNTGVLSLIDCDNTLITGIAQELTEEVSTARVQLLINAGIIGTLNISNPEMNSSIRNNTVSDNINNYAALFDGSTSPIPDRVLLTDSTPLDDNIIDVAYIDGIEEGTTLVLSNNTTIAAGAYTKVFNVMTNGFALTIEEGATIRSWDSVNIKDLSGYLFFSNRNHLGLVPAASGGSVSGSFSNPTGIIANRVVSVQLFL